VAGAGYRNPAGRGDAQAPGKDLQIIFQDPLASLNPRMTVGEIIADPLKALMPELKAKERRTRVVKHHGGRRPSARNDQPLSARVLGRSGAAHRHRRALITEPKLIVCDEPVSALDVSIQAQILNLLAELKEEFGLTLIFISHNLSGGAARVGPYPGAVSGRIVELGDR
jgi:oligopeptide transport system ATP-binding protein